MRNTNVDNIRNVIARCSCDICIIYTHMYGYLQCDINSGKKNYDIFTEENEKGNKNNVIHDILM